MLFIKYSLQIKRHTQTESKGMEKRYFMTMNMKKNAGVAILILDKTDFKTKAISRAKMGPATSLLGVYP